MSISARDRLLLSSILAVLFIISLWKLNDYPPLSWDEGWTLQVARNWVELGHYGLYQDGLARDAGLAGHFPIVALISLSFRMFGVGVWQGRLPAVLSSIGILVILFRLSFYWWSNRYAWATLFTSIFLCFEPVNLLYYGRQALGEVIALSLLLLGYVTLDHATTRSRMWLIAVGLLWGIGIAAKSQPLPFWVISVSFYCLASYLSHQPIKIKLILTAALGAVAVYWMNSWIQGILTASLMGKQPIIQGLVGVTAIVLDRGVRLSAVKVLLLAGLPGLFGLIWQGKQMVSEIKNEAKKIQSIQWALWGFSASWLTWYILIGMHWPRYLFPAVLVASPFTAAWLLDWTQNFNLGTMLHLPPGGMVEKIFWKWTKALFTWVFVIFIMALNAHITYVYTFRGSTLAPIPAASTIQETVPDGKLVETYESEIMFLAPDIRYHYPPDYISVQGIARNTLDERLQVDYDPMEFNPDFILVGDFGRSWGVYEGILATDIFKLVDSFYGYQLYARNESDLVK